MYGTELIVPKSPNGPSSVHVCKRETDPAALAEVLGNGTPFRGSIASGYVHSSIDISTTTDTLVSLRYKPTARARLRSPSLRAQVAIATRRLLSEIRDEVVHKVLVPR